MLTANLHLALMSSMSGTVPLLPLYAFVVWTGTLFLYRLNYLIFLFFRLFEFNIELCL